MTRATIPSLRKRLWGRGSPGGARGVRMSWDEKTTEQPTGDDGQKASMFGEQARDMQDAIDSLPVSVFRVATEYYVPPFALGNIPVEPTSIEAVRVQYAYDDAATVPCSSACSWKWNSAGKSATITAIDGLSTAERKKYRFTFRVTYPPYNGGR